MNEDPPQPELSYWSLIPTHILDDPRIDDATAILYCRISSLANNKGYCWASDKYLAELTGVSDREVRNRIKTLEDCEYIRRETQKNGVLWDRKIFPNYNHEGIIRSARTDHMNPSRGSGVPNTNINNNSIRKKEESGSKAAPSESEFGLVDLFFEKIKEIDPKAKEPNRQKWAEDIEKMHRIDKRSYEEIKSLIEFAQQDPFWSTNILCTETLRKQATKLIAKMRAAKPTVSTEEQRVRSNLEIAENFILAHTKHFQTWCCVKLLHSHEGVAAGIEIKTGSNSKFLKLTEGGIADQLDSFRRTALKI